MSSKNKTFKYMSAKFIPELTVLGKEVDDEKMMISRQHHGRLWKKYHSGVICRKNNRLGKCNICLDLKALLRRLKPGPDKDAAQKELDEHHNLYTTGQQDYVKRRLEYVKTPTEILSIAIDGESFMCRMYLFLRYGSEEN